MSGVLATGMGSWPGTDVREALRVVRGELTGAAPEGVQPLPYLPELPARGPGADMIGRAAHLLVDLQVDLQPQGWRLVPRPGRDHERTGSWWRQDLDELAEAYDGYTGPLKVQVTGPWTLAASIWLPLGDRVLSDRGATRDLAGSLADGLAEHAAQVRRLVPGAELVVQLDEPSLSAVALGRVRSESGYRVLRTPEPGELATLLRGAVDGARAGGAARVAVHSCAPELPLDTLGHSGAEALALDLAQLSTRDWEALAPLIERGTQLWAGLLPTTPTAPATSTSRPTSGPTADPAAGPERPVAQLARRWRELGLPMRDLAGLGVSPACGLAGLPPQRARALTAATRAAAEELAELADA